MVKYAKSAHMAFLQKTNGGILYLIPDLLISVCTLIPLMALWRVVLSAGGEEDMSVAQMLTYTYLSALLADLMVVKTPASGWLSEGVLLGLYTRPMTVLGQLMAQTVGGWLPRLLLFSLPMAVLSPLFGVGLVPATPWFFLSLALCVSLGFAIDILFACLSIRLRNLNWLIDRIRTAITSLLSGAVIPIRLLPPVAAEVLRFQPFASLGGSPLSLFVGAAGPREVLALQLMWNALLWPAALLVFWKSQEGVVSYGG